MGVQGSGIEIYSVRLKVSGFQGLRVLKEGG